LITGPAGQGKTTTLAAMINLINREHKKCRIVTIEDPIEYLHENINGIVIQREVGIDTKSFSSGLVQSLRQDPNIICIGEIRDLETIATALTAAETGHLVLATLHTPDAPQCIDRVVDVFPSHQQQQIRIQLASSLEAVIAQKLLPRSDGKGRIIAVETLIGSSAVRNLIRERKTEQLYGVMQTSAAHGMILMDDYLRYLYEKDLISLETALSKARDPKNIKE
jgi:twitching motility protein PilT